METMGAVMDKLENIQGLCVTCNHLEGCKSRLQDGPVIWYCEEFDDFIATEGATTEYAENRDLLNGFHPGVMGLCINCEHGGTCEHAKRTGGVWFCEQYE